MRRLELAAFAADAVLLTAGYIHRPADLGKIEKDSRAAIQPAMMAMDCMAANAATVTPAAIKPYSTTRVAPAKSVTAVLRGKRAMELELATILSPQVRRTQSRQTRGESFRHGETACR